MRPFAGPLGEVLAKWKVTTPAAEVLQMWHHVNVDPGVVAAVRELRASGVRCALATNQHPERAAYMRESLGYDEVFDDLFYSCDLGVAKPDPAYFTEAVRRLGTDPAARCCSTTTPTTWRGRRRPVWWPSCSRPTADGPELDRILGAYARK